MTCSAYAERCVCNQDAGHGEPHTCDCGGSWRDDGTVLAWPNTDPKSGLSVETMAAADDAFASLVASRPPLPYRDAFMRRGYR